MIKIGIICCWPPSSVWPPSKSDPSTWTMLAPIPSAGMLSFAVFLLAVYGCLRHRWQNRQMYCNPPFEQIKASIEHSWAEFHYSAPTTTQATFILPTCWFSAPWWKALAGARVVGYFVYPAMFTRPDWRLASMREQPVPQHRSFSGPNEWGVELIHFPSVLLEGSTPHAIDMPRLSANKQAHCLLLRGTRDTLSAICAGAARGRRRDTDAPEWFICTA